MSLPPLYTPSLNMNSAQAIERLRFILRRQHKALATEDAYVFWVRRFIRAIATMDPHLPSEKKIEAYLSQMARTDVSASTQNQAFNAILYFYREVLEKPLGNVNALRARRPAHQRHAPSIVETQLLLQAVHNVGGYPTNLIARLLYGCGLRVSEPLNLRIKDINLERRTICIRGAKGGNDRLVVLPTSLMPELVQQMQVARAVWHGDCQNRTPLMLPHRLAFKYPEFQFNWDWAWLFPSIRTRLKVQPGGEVRGRLPPLYSFSGQAGKGQTATRSWPRIAGKVTTLRPGGAASILRHREAIDARGPSKLRPDDHASWWVFPVHSPPHRSCRRAEANARYGGGE